MSTNYVFGLYQNSQVSRILLRFRGETVPIEMEVFRGLEFGMYLERCPFCWYVGQA